MGSGSSHTDVPKRQSVQNECIYSQVSREEERDWLMGDLSLLMKKQLFEDGIIASIFHFMKSNNDRIVSLVVGRFYNPETLKPMSENRLVLIVVSV